MLDIYRPIESRSGEVNMYRQGPIKESRYLPYLALESTLSRVDLLIERLPQFDETIKTELWQSLFYPHAPDQAGDSEERLDDSSDESSDTVHVSSSENSASSDSERREDNLVSQKTSCDGGERRKPAKRNAATTTRTTQPRKKRKLAIFFQCSRFYTQQNYDTFRRKKPF